MLERGSFQHGDGAIAQQGGRCHGPAEGVAGEGVEPVTGRQNHLRFGAHLRVLEHQRQADGDDDHVGDSVATASEREQVVGARALRQHVEILAAGRESGRMAAPHLQTRPDHASLRVIE